MTELILLSRTDSDLQEAYNYCEDYRRGGGDEFLHHFDRTIHLILGHPGIGAPTPFKPYRRMIVKGYPFAIFYIEQRDRVLVAAVLDLRQPRWAILRRLGLREG